MSVLHASRAVLLSTRLRIFMVVWALTKCCLTYFRPVRAVGGPADPLVTLYHYDWARLVHTHTRI